MTEEVTSPIKTHATVNSRCLTCDQDMMMQICEADTITSIPIHHYCSDATAIAEFRIEIGVAVVSGPCDPENDWKYRL